MQRPELELSAKAFLGLIDGTSTDVPEEMAEDSEEDNPMGLKLREFISGFREENFGVVDLYVFWDHYGTHWGVELYRGLGKHDNFSELGEILHEVATVDEPETLLLREIVRKATYTYNWM